MTLPRIEATGRLGNEPELKFTTGGKAVAEFSIACDENKKNGDQWEKVSTTWLRVAVWEKDAEAVAEHLKKGDLVTVIGQLTVREYEKKDGSKGTSVEVKNANVTKALPREKSGASSSGGGGWSQSAPTPAADPWASQPASGQSVTEEPPF
jgi:single-strand DNA-binding protein